MDGMSPPTPTENSSPSKSVSMEMMRRSFYWGSDVEFYFANWPSGTVVMYILALALLLVISVINEYLWAGGLVQTLGLTGRVATAFLLMLAVVSSNFTSYNLGVVAVVIAGFAIGFYLFGRQHAREEESYPTDTESKP